MKIFKALFGTGFILMYGLLVAMMVSTMPTRCNAWDVTLLVVVIIATASLVASVIYALVRYA